MNNDQQTSLSANNGISWSAIIVGALVSIGLSFLLNLFSMAMGLSALHTNPDKGMTLAIGGLMGLAIASIAIMFFSGWVSGFLGRMNCFHPNGGALYGFSAWCLALVMTILLTAPVGRFIAHFSNFIANPTYASINVADRPTAPAISTVSTHPPQVIVNPEKVARMGAFIVFVLFFLGALASTLGGYCGLISCRHSDKMSSRLNTKNM